MALLKRRLAALGRGVVSPRAVERTTFEDLVAMLRTDYEKNHRRSKSRMEDAVAHLALAFAGNRAIAITTDRIDDYVVARQKKDKAAAATINRELAMLRRMFRLGERAGTGSARPYIALLPEDNVRQGFFEPGVYAAVLAALPPALRPVVTFGYITGWRIRSEALPLTWPQVDFDAGTVRLEPGTTKTGRGRTFAMTPELRACLLTQQALTKQQEHAQERIIPFVFHRDGAPIKHFRRAWRTAVRAAGQPQLIPHDLRRTAVRNLVRAGVSEHVAMTMTGHKTRAVFDRYDIVNDQDQREAAARLGTFHAQQAAAPALPTVVPLARQISRERVGKS